jgi:hypothetical protein
MKVGIATTLSIAGVLAAGAAAFAVNTSVLTASTSATANEVLLPAQSVASNQAVASPVLPIAKQTVVNSTPVTGKVTTYQVGSSGSVVIDRTSGAIVVTNVVPAAGWTSEPARTEPNGDVQVHFVSGASRIEFTARMLNGSVNISVRAEQAPPALASLGTAPIAKPAYRDNDDYEERDDDHDDRDEEEDDDDHDEDDD